MFKKKPNIKPLAPLRSSDRRRTADQIIADYDLKVPTGDEVSPEEKAASTAKHTELRNSLLPDNAQSARFTTTHGPDLKKVSGTVYVGSHAGEEQRVLWVKIEERMYPTVYTLWHNPGILPLLHTHPPVVQKLQGGADLMTPGLAGRPPFPLKAKKGSITAIASTESPSVPVVVGVCEIDVSALQQVQGAKGHAVHTIHWCGDELWAWSSSGKPGGAAPERLDGWDEHTEEDEMAEQTEKMDLENGEEDGGVALGGDEPAVQKTSERIDYVEGEDAPTQSEADADEREMTTNEIDEAFRKAFFYGVHHHVIANKDLPTHGLRFPLSQSFVMSNLVQPFLPAFTPSQSNSLQIKKTSWKNIKKFLKSLDKEKVLRCKDRDGNEVVVQDIDFTDRAVVDFVPYRLPKKETAAGTSVGRGGKATTTGDESDESIGQTLKVVSIYRPKEKFSPIFSVAKVSSKPYYTAAELRTLITTYIDSENLASPTNKRLVTINPILANAVFDGTGALDKEVLAKSAVPRDALIDRIISSCAPFHAVLRNGASADAAKPKAGAAPKIRVLLETRSGNKTVTKISGVEAYHVPPQPLADELRKACAGSTSVDQLVGSSPKNPVMEVMVQGPQKDAVIRALERRGVHRTWVEVVDKTKKGKGR